MATKNKKKIVKHKLLKKELPTVRETFSKSLHIYVQGGFPLLMVDTPEVDRATDVLFNFAQGWEKILPETNAPKELKIAGFDFAIWDCINGLRNVEVKNGTVEYKAQTNTIGVVELLEYLVKSRAKAGMYVLQNFHMMLADQQMLPMYVQLLRDIASKCKEQHKHIVIVGAIDKLPLEIQSIVVPIEFSLPDKEEIEEFIGDYVQELGVMVSDKEVEEASSASTGMTLLEIEGAVCVAVTESGGEHINRDIIFQEKSKAVQKSNLLELLQTEETMATVGGVENLKYWYDRIAKAFIERHKADQYGLPYPKGCIITGVQGTGKTLSAKAVASYFKVPLFRCDVGKLFSSGVGDTERNTRELLRLMTAVSPAVFLFDEIEKALGGVASSDQSDAGVTKRLMSSLLYFMEEGVHHGTFIIATANDVTSLSPELIRRFEELN